MSLWKRNYKSKIKVTISVAQQMMVVTWFKTKAMNRVMIVTFWTYNKCRIKVMYNWIQYSYAKNRTVEGGRLNHQKNEVVSQ